MKKYVLQLTLLFLFINGFTQEKGNNPDFLQEINVSRENINVSSMKLDSSLVCALNEINKRWTKPTGVGEDSIRSVLNTFNNHDYQIKLLKVELEKGIDLNNLLKNNVDLSNLAMNSNYNQIGYIEVHETDKDYLLILATQNYIQFDDRLFMEIYNLEGGGFREFTTLKGSSTSDYVCYYLTNSKESKNHTKVADSKNLVIENNGRFSIKIDMINFRQQKFDCVTFYNKSGEIIANFKLQ
ncbi:MAG: hypothetical protein RBS73_12300 [Prolixibacteraceae bacterium]|jgi:hypothetical protein|nr:hypothetical protein [Prolixibacteraceae bacterium]